MKVSITQKITKETDIEVKFPSFYKGESKHFIAFYSESKIVRVYVADGCCQIACLSDIDLMYSIERYMCGGEISEELFNGALAHAMFMISGVEVVPTLALQD